MYPVPNNSHVLSDATSLTINAGHLTIPTYYTPKEVYIKRPMNAFILWSREKRKELGRENPKMPNQEKSKILGATWKKMTQTEKTPYIDQAKRMRLQHMKDHPNYKFKPRRRQKNCKATLDARPSANYGNFPQSLGLYAIPMPAAISHSLVYRPYYQPVCFNAPGAPFWMLPPSSAISADGNNNYLDANSLHHLYSMISTAGKPTTLTQDSSNLYFQLNNGHTMETNSLHFQMSSSTSRSIIINNLQPSSPTSSVSTMTSSTLDPDSLHNDSANFHVIKSEEILGL